MKTRSDQRLRERLGRWFLASLVVATSRPAIAQERPRTDAAQDVTSSDARALYQEGSRRYHAGEYDQAALLFERAYALSGASALLLNLAQAYRLRGPTFCAQSLSLYRRYLESKPDSEHRDEVEQRIAEMDACVRTSPPRPTTAVDAEPTAAAPAPPTAPMTPAPAAPEPDRSSRPSSLRTLGWVGLGVGAAGWIVAGVGGGIALSQEASLSDLCRSDGGCPETETRRIDRYETARAVAIGGAVVGVIGVGIGVAGLVAGSRASSPRETRGSSLQVVWTGTGAGICGAF